jgi:hypothetical protein
LPESTQILHFLPKGCDGTSDGDLTKVILGSTEVAAQPQACTVPQHLRVVVDADRTGKRFVAALGRLYVPGAPVANVDHGVDEAGVAPVEVK